ncbi:hypothetical protein ES703_122076 [subsurface metagenome]
MMKKLEDAIKAVKIKSRIEATAAGGQSKEKTSEELKKEIAENKEAMADLENEPANEPEKKDLINGLEIHTTKPPPKPTHMDCPFCESEKTIKGMNRHIDVKSLRARQRLIIYRPRSQKSIFLIGRTLKKIRKTTWIRKKKQAGILMIKKSLKEIRKREEKSI